MNITFPLNSSDPPFGMVMPGRSWQAGSAEGYGFGFNGKEQVNEIKGNTNSYDFEARIYDSRIGKFLSLDPLSNLYPQESNFSYVSNNPIIYIDANGKDKVYFDENGNELEDMRVKSDVVFETYVKTSVVYTFVLGQGLTEQPKFEQAQMPGVIKGFEDPKYQKLDYIIAAKVFLFNKKLAEGLETETIFSGSTGTEFGLKLKKNYYLTQLSKMPNELDVNLIKAMAIQESGAGAYTGGMGTGPNDPMQVGNSGDNADKHIIGLSNNEVLTPERSVELAINWLFYKGFQASGDLDPEWKTEFYQLNWVQIDGGWETATKNYNSRLSYLTSLTSKYNSIVPANRENYVDSSKPGMVVMDKDVENSDLIEAE